MITNEGLNNILNSWAPIAETAVARNTDIYLVPCSAAYTPQATDTMADLASYVEITTYNEATRPEWVANGASSASSLTNSVAPASITLNSGASINNVLVTTISTKSATTGLLIAAAPLARPGLLSGDVLTFEWTLGIADS